MKAKTAFILVLVLTFQPSLAHSDDGASWYQDPILWATLGAASVTSYVIGGRLKQGMSKVLPALVTSTVFLGTAGYTVLSRRFNLHWVTATLPAVALFSYLIYKALRTCPTTGSAGCCCHLGA
ncbi:MAG: hypothetical protein WCK42_05715 [Myxococcaceae bacterium]